MQAQYDPKATEEKYRKFWLDGGFFDADRNPRKQPFCVVIPPPNITGILHMGHALNNTIQDVLVRYKRMAGLESLWMPGTDHAGIATQNVVERALAQENLRKEDIGRERFLERLWRWYGEYGSTIINQLKQLGASCDWRRTRFTMDDGYSKAVKEVFVRLYEKGLIYKGNYIINWCPRCRTALADEEAPYKEINGRLYYIRYPIEYASRTAQNARRYIVVATTRPETMLGDTAVAINPKDRKYRFLKNCRVILPLVGRQLEVIEDSVVEASFGTGIVKVTPAHDKNDFLMAKRHNLEFVNIMNDDATLNNNACDFAGMDRFEAREALLDVLEQKDLLEKEEPYKISAGHCYRCHTIVEPRLSAQWFVRMKPLAKSAIKVVEKKKIRFHPDRWRKVYLNWMQNIQDWCISRQIWWGHRLPVYYCKSCMKEAGSKFQIPSSKFQTNSKSQIQNCKEKGVIVSRVRPDKCPKCGSTEIEQDSDVLDTWFSSWLWPFATFYWPPDKTTDNRQQTTDQDSLKSEVCGLKSDLDYFYPTDVLVTASEILFFWVARMIMAGMEFMQDIPFKHVLIHGTVRDIRGIKMSKSLGNVIDPLQIIDKFGADALRFSLMLLASSGQDVYLSEEKFLVGRNFANKIWNAARFIIEREQRTENREQRINVGDLSLADKWIVHELNTLIREVSSDLEKFRINEAARALYEFFWHKFCDWYIEISKVDESESKEIILGLVLAAALKLLHPLMPFITEDIYRKIKRDKDPESIMKSSWPKKLSVKIAKTDINDFLKLKELVVSVRGFRKDLGIIERVKLIVTGKDRSDTRILRDNLEWIQFLSRADIATERQPSADYISTATIDYDILICKEHIKDVKTHKKKVEKRIEGLTRIIKSQKEKLNSRSFLKKAPGYVIKKTEERVTLSLEERKRLERIKWP